MSHAPWQPTSHPKPNRAQRRRSGQTRRTASVLAGTLVATGVGTVIVAAPAAASISTINADRAGAGLGPLAESAGLDSLAASHSRAMAAAGSLFHTSNLAGAIGSVVPGWTAVGENVGVGSSLAEVNSMFMASAQHRSNILGSYTVAGLGVATGPDGRVWVTEEFAKTSTAPKIATSLAPAPAPTPASSPATTAATSLAATAAPSRIASSTPAESTTRTVVSVIREANPAPVVPAIVGGFSSGSGYVLVAADGGVFAFGDAPFAGSMAGHAINAPVVSSAETPSGQGYVLAASDGGVFNFGDAPFLGSMAGRQVSAPIVSLAMTPSGHGYWLAGADGAVYAFGDAPYLGGANTAALNSPIVGMAPSPSGAGYRLIAGDGGVFTYGTAAFAGSAAGIAGLRSWSPS